MKLIDCSTPKYPNTFAMVDDEDFDHLNQWKWHIMKTGRVLYATRKKIGGDRACILMHREILQPSDGLRPDHIDGNGLNNQRSNLRACTQAENARNARPQVGGSSRFKGVSWDKEFSKWQSYINLNGKKTRLGRFTSEEAAALAYNCAASVLYGGFAKLNSIGGVE